MIMFHAGCAFIKYKTVEEAEKSIAGLHNMKQLPGVSIQILVSSITLLLHTHRSQAKHSVEECSCMCTSIQFGTDSWFYGDRRAQDIVFMWCKPLEMDVGNMKGKVGSFVQGSSCLLVSFLALWLKRGLLCLCRATGQSRCAMQMGRGSASVSIAWYCI